MVELSELLTKRKKINKVDLQLLQFRAAHLSSQIYCLKTGFNHSEIKFNSISFHSKLSMLLHKGCYFFLNE